MPARRLTPVIRMFLPRRGNGSRVSWDSGEVVMYQVHQMRAAIVAASGERRSRGVAGVSLEVVGGK